jgi:hypothetical protein
MTYKSPSNATEYWNIVDTHWDDLFHILNVYLPTFSSKWIDGTQLDKPLGEYITELKETRNGRLVRVLNAAWFAVPDNKSSEGEHTGWNILCDLCSEEYVLHEPKESETDESNTST